MARNLAAARGGVLPGSGFGISRKTFNQLEEFIRDNESSIEKVQFGIDKLVQLMAMVTVSEARKKSFGPVAARQRSNPALAGRIPVQRITGAYFAGWYIRRRGNGRWVVGNDAWEAYLIETGMYQTVRRPILKMSVISMLRFIQTTRTAERFMDDVLKPRRKGGRFQSFQSRMMGTRTLGGMAGPKGVLP